jgi:hypothetical protein
MPAARARRGRRLAAFGLAVCACLTVLIPAPWAAADLPPRLSDETFWNMITEFSEDGGYFHSDNFTSNEITFQYVIPELTRNLSAGGVYLGVGPEQNFTYIVALRPKIAFIIDIRRQNMLEHLLYKALIESSGDRAEFLSRLFSRKRPPELGPTTPADALFASFRLEKADRQMFQQTLQAVKDVLIVKHGFPLSADDQKQIEYVFKAFYDHGPALRYSFTGASAAVLELFPTYEDVQTSTDFTGERRGYLATEANFRALAELERNNLIVPLVGDFAGPKTLSAVGRYLAAHGATVTAFYTSNVEQYLFQNANVWKNFYANVAKLPLDPGSLFIRSVSRSEFASLGPRSLSMPRLSPIPDVVQAVNDGRINKYSDVVAMSSDRIVR